MVFFPNCPGLEVRVSCNGRALREYRNATEEDQVNSLTRYVEADSGAPDATCCKVPYDHHFAHGGVLATLHIDGTLMHLGVARAQYASAPTWRRDLGGSTAYINGMNMIQPSRLSQLLEENDSRNEDTNTSIQKAGSILVRFYEVTNFRPAAPSEQNFLALPDHATMPKKVLKAASLSHLTSLEPPRPATPHSTRKKRYVREYFDLLDGEQSRPFAEVRFKYRSLDVLKTLDLQPRTGLGKQLMKAENDDANSIKKEEDINDHDQLHFQAKKESVDEDLQAGANPVEADIHIKKELIEEDVHIKEEPVNEDMQVRPERAEHDIRVKKEPVEEDAHI